MTALAYQFGRFIGQATKGTMLARPVVAGARYLLGLFETRIPDRYAALDGYAQGGHLRIAGAGPKVAAGPGATQILIGRVHTYHELKRRADEAVDEVLEHIQAGDYRSAASAAHRADGLLQELDGRRST